MCRLDAKYTDFKDNEHEKDSKLDNQIEATRQLIMFLSKS